MSQVLCPTNMWELHCLALVRSNDLEMNVLYWAVLSTALKGGTSSQIGNRPRGPRKPKNLDYSENYFLNQRYLMPSH